MENGWPYSIAPWRLCQRKCTHRRESPKSAFLSARSTGRRTGLDPGIIERLKNWGFNTIGNWSDPRIAARYYIENCAADPHIIGAHWFQLVDDLPTERPSDGERLNYGFLNVIDLPYRELVEAAQKSHRRLYDLKFGKTMPVRARPRYN